jgi:hypothetical protein
MNRGSKGPVYVLNVVTFFLFRAKRVCSQFTAVCFYVQADETQLYANKNVCLSPETILEARFFPTTRDSAIFSALVNSVKHDAGLSADDACSVTTAVLTVQGQAGSYVSSEYTSGNADRSALCMRTGSCAHDSAAVQATTKFRGFTIKYYHIPIVYCLHVASSARCARTWPHSSTAASACRQMHCAHYHEH